MKSNYLSPDHNAACQMLAVARQEGSSSAASTHHLSHPVFSWTNLWEIESFTFSLFGIGGSQPDVQSCLLKHSPCLGFGSWTDSQPCGMAAVEGLFKLHPGWWVAVRRAMDREFRKGKKRDGRAGVGGGWGGGAGRTVTLTPRCTKKEMSWILKKLKYINWRQQSEERGVGHW